MIDRMNNESLEVMPWKDRLKFMDRYYNHIKGVEAIWNECLKKYGLGHIKFDASVIYNTPREVLAGSHEICGFIGESVEGRKGRIWPNQIETSVLAIKKMLDTRNEVFQSGVIIGSTQCGKTGTINNLRWIGPLMKLLIGELFLPITLLPNKCGLADQSSTEAKRFMEFYGNACMVNSKTGEKITLRGYNNQHSISQDILMPNDDASYRHNKGSLLRRSRGQHGVDRIAEITKAAFDVGMKVVFLVDEPDNGADVESVQAVMLKYTDVLEQGEMKKWGCCMIGCSATPWQFYNLDNLWNVRHKLAIGYCGFNFLDGDPIDPDIKCQHPDFWSFETAATMTKIPDLAHMDRGRYQNAKTFDKWVQKEEIWPEGMPKDWEGYRGKMRAALVKYIHWALLGRGNIRGGRGFLLRIINHNSKMSEIVQEMWKQGLDKRIQVLEYSGNETQQAVAKKISKLDIYRPYLIIVTGAGRRADCFPIDVKYAVDCSWDTNLTALFQGLLGRMTGHYKGKGGLPLVMLSERSVEKLQEFVDSNGRFYERPHRHVDLMGEDGCPIMRQRSKNSLEIDVDMLNRDPVLAPVAKRIQLELVDKLILGNQKPTLEGKRGVVNYMPFFDIFTEKIMRYIETHVVTTTGHDYDVQPRFLRPGEKDEKGYYYKLNDDENLARIGFRQTKSDASNVGRNGKLRGNQSDRIARGKGTNDLDIQIWVERVDRGKSKAVSWKFLSIKLRTVRDIRPYAKGGNILPNNTTFTSNFRTDNETHKIDYHRELMSKRRKKNVD